MRELSEWSTKDRKGITVYEIGAGSLKPVLYRRTATAGDRYETTAIFGGDLVTVAGPDEILIGNVRRGTWQSFESGPSGPDYFAFTESGFLATVEGQLFRLWGMTGELLSFSKLSAKALSFEPRTTRLAAFVESGGSIEVGDARNFARRQVLPNVRNDGSRWLLWEPGYLVAGGGTSIDFFDSRDLLRPPFSFESDLYNAVALHRDVVAVVTPERLIFLKLRALEEQVATLSTAARRKVVCSRTGRDLTPEEWTAYAEGREYVPVCRGAN